MVFKVVKESMGRHINRIDTPDFFIKSGDYTKMSDMGLLQKSVYISELTHYQANDATEFQHPAASFVLNTNEMPWKVTSDSGNSKFGLDAIVLNGNVVINQSRGINNKETTINTASATIYFNKKYVETDQLISVKQEGLLVEALGANANFNSGIINLLGNVKQVYIPEIAKISESKTKANPEVYLNASDNNKQEIYLNSDKATYNRKKHISIYLGNVKYKQGSSFLEANKLVIYDNEADNTVERIIAFGVPAHYSTIPNGKGSRIHARAMKIEYYPKKKIALLIGDAELTQKDNKFSGSHITYDLENQTVLSRSNNGDKNYKNQKTTIIIKP